MLGYGDRKYINWRRISRNRNVTIMRVIVQNIYTMDKAIDHMRIYRLTQHSIYKWHS